MNRSRNKLISKNGYVLSYFTSTSAINVIFILLGLQIYSQSKVILQQKKILNRYSLNTTLPYFTTLFAPANASANKCIKLRCIKVGILCIIRPLSLIFFSQNTHLLLFKTIIYMKLALPETDDGKQK